MDRAVRLRREHGSAGSHELEHWEQLRDRIGANVLEHGWHEEAGAYSVAYGHPEMDASSLWIGLSGLLSDNDPRFLSTVLAIEAELRSGPTVYRYKWDDGMPGKEGGELSLQGLFGRRRRSEDLLRPMELQRAEAVDIDLDVDVRPLVAQPLLGDAFLQDLDEARVDIHGLAARRQASGDAGCPSIKGDAETPGVGIALLGCSAFRRRRVRRSDPIWRDEPGQGDGERHEACRKVLQRGSDRDHSLDLSPRKGVSNDDH